MSREPNQYIRKRSRMSIEIEDDPLTRPCENTPILPLTATRIADRLLARRPIQQLASMFRRRLTENNARLISLCSRDR